jgi:hypothetical protein
MGRALAAGFCCLLMLLVTEGTKSRIHVLLAAPESELKCDTQVKSNLATAGWGGVFASRGQAVPGSARHKPLL